MENLGFVEFFVHLISLDIPWLAYLLLNNLAWIMAYMAVMYIFMGSFRKAIMGSLILAFNLWMVVDFIGSLGLIVFVGNLLMLFYIGKFTVLTAVQDSPNLRKNMIVFSEAQGWGTIILFNLGIFALFGLGGA